MSDLEAFLTLILEDATVYRLPSYSQPLVYNPLQGIEGCLNAMRVTYSLSRRMILLIWPARRMTFASLWIISGFDESKDFPEVGKQFFGRAWEVMYFWRLKMSSEPVFVEERRETFPNAKYKLKWKCKRDFWGWDCWHRER